MEITNMKRFQEALKHAIETGDMSLHRGFESLKRYEELGYKVQLNWDFAPLSFGFSILTQDDKLYMGGGLIYHGNPDESFSITLQKTTGWSIHT